MEFVPRTDISGKWPEKTSNGKIPMHPDDFTALLAWISAKRFQETISGKHFAEKPVWFTLISCPRSESNLKI
jgi:hypothetical protein